MIRMLLIVVIKKSLTKLGHQVHAVMLMVCFRKEKGSTSEGATEETDEPEGMCEGARITGLNSA